MANPGRQSFTNLMPSTSTGEATGPEPENRTDTQRDEKQRSEPSAANFALHPVIIPHPACASCPARPVATRDSLLPANHRSNSLRSIEAVRVGSDKGVRNRPRARQFRLITRGEDRGGRGGGGGGACKREGAQRRRRLHRPLHPRSPPLVTIIVIIVGAP